MAQAAFVPDRRRRCLGNRVVVDVMTKMVTLMGRLADIVLAKPSDRAQDTSRQQ